MRRLTRKTSLSVALYLFTSTATASAECAWVLWSFQFNKDSGVESQEVDSAHATRQECDGAVSRKATILKARGWDVAGAFPGSYEVLGTKENNTWRFYCLPDTVDPRGPKR